jgi:hypothetical protein
MSSASGYRVKFGNIARTLLYEDSKGTILFTFDVGPLAKPQTLFLERGNKALDQDEQQKIDLALERTKEYLVSCGYQVYVV